jgi:long-chain acyl-CoA synthetase
MSGNSALLLHKCRSADAPAYREKEYGIWQAGAGRRRATRSRRWRWHDGAGLNEGDFVSIIGPTRPTKMMAAEMCGRCLPLYQDANVRARWPT